MTFQSIFNDLILLFAFLLAGWFVRELIKPLQRFYIPASIVGGVLALILGPQVLNLVAIPESWSSMASVMITLVLTCSVIGVDMDKSKANAYFTHLCIMVSVYGMQMFLGCGIGSLMEDIWPELPFGWGSEAVFSFWGGHGTAASAGAAWEEYGITSNTSVGMIMSTLGVISCFVFGMIMINIGVRKGWTTQASNDFKNNPSFFGGMLSKEQQTPVGMATVPSTGIDGFSFQLAIVLSCMAFGNWFMDLFKSAIVNVPYLSALSQLPDLINGILAGMLVWNVIKRTRFKGFVDRRTINSISGLGLEITITSAVGTMDLELVSALIVPILLLSAVIVALTAAFCLILCKSWHRTNWFEKCCGSFGAATGSVPTGLALIRCVDPDGKTDAADTLAIGNSLWAPVYGSMPALLPLFAVTIGMFVPIWLGFAFMVVPLIIGFIFFRKK